MSQDGEVDIGGQSRAPAFVLVATLFISASPVFGQAGWQATTGGDAGNQFFGSVSHSSCFGSVTDFLTRSKWSSKWRTGRL